MEEEFILIDLHVAGNVRNGWIVVDGRQCSGDGNRSSKQKSDQAETEARPAGERDEQHRTDKIELHVHG